MSNPNRLDQLKRTSAQAPRGPMTKVEKLALLNRYVFPIVAIIGPMLVAWLLKWDVLIPLGLGCYVFGAYQLIGYKKRWNHIYCSIQLFRKQQMTPENIQWDRVRAFDATALPIAFVVLGTLALLFGTNGM